MMPRMLLLTSLAMLTACANYAPIGTGRTDPAPVERSEPAQVSEPDIVGPPLPPPRDEQRSGTSVPGSDRTPVPEAPMPAPQRAPATASSTLLASVDAALAEGDLERAAAISERALRISPRDAYLWYRLASIRYQQQNMADARGFAQRALSYAGSDAALRRDIAALLQEIANR